jgi:predicted ATPase/DNA-binding XRE family transcriptional regulator
MFVDRPAPTSAAESFGVALRDHRRAAGLSQEVLAERAGVSPRSISAFESASGITPRRDTVALLARALGLNSTDRGRFEALVSRRPRSPRAVRDVSALRHTLQRQLDSFVGRDAEMRDLGRVLGTAPLVTLVGAGGIGKTRLALEVAQQHSSTFTHGVAVVDIAELSDASLIACSVAEAVGVDATRGLIDYLRSRRLLLVLDGCERHLQACAQLASQLLRACPNLHIQATSREPLGIDGEVTRLVQALELPDARTRLSVARIAQSAAVRLFVDRAGAVDQTFELTDDNLSAVVRVCTSVDAIPLGLELAAVRLRVLTVDQLADRLPRDLHILSSVNRGGPPRHRTMRANLDWSHGLLGERERILLRRLAVFVGGWTLQLAEDVCSGGGVERADVLHTLGQLIDKSLVHKTAHVETARYRLLEPIRQYAVDRLDASGEAHEYAARHDATLFARATPENVDDDVRVEIATLRRFEPEHANLRVA